MIVEDSSSELSTPSKELSAVEVYVLVPFQLLH